AYLEAIRNCRRRPLPTAAEVAALARRGYPVRPGRRERVRAAARSLLRSAPAPLLRALSGVRTAARRGEDEVRRVRWVADESLPRRKSRLSQLPSFTF